MAKILIVEDNPDNLKLFRALLSLQRHEVTALTSGDGLLETMGEVQPELVLMDIQLPGKDGFELLAELRRSGWGVPVIGLSAHAMAGDEQRARAAGFDGYITKPIEIATFPGQIERALKSPRAKVQETH